MGYDGAPYEEGKGCEGGGGYEYEGGNPADFGDIAEEEEDDDELEEYPPTDPDGGGRSYLLGGPFWTNC